MHHCIVSETLSECFIFARHSEHAGHAESKGNEVYATSNLQLNALVLFPELAKRHVAQPHAYRGHWRQTPFCFTFQTSAVPLSNFGLFKAIYDSGG